MTLTFKNRRCFIMKAYQAIKTEMLFLEIIHGLNKHIIFAYFDINEKYSSIKSEAVLDYAKIELVEQLLKDGNIIELTKEDAKNWSKIIS